MSRPFRTGARRSHPSKIAAATPGHLHPAIMSRLADHASGAAPLPASVDLGQHWPSILDQSSTGSCTAHAIACAVVTTLAAASKPLGFVPSPKLTYAATRALERADVTPPGSPLAPLTDSGGMIADVIAVIATDGVRPMHAPSPGGFNSDIDGTNVNDEIAVSDLEVSMQRVLSGPYHVDPAATNASDVLAAALAVGIAIDCAFECDDAFQALGPGDVAQAPVDAPDDGGHSVALTGFVTNPDGTRSFWLTNSWSESWATGGRTLVSPAFIKAMWEAWPVAISDAAGMK